MSPFELIVRRFSFHFPNQSGASRDLFVIPVVASHVTCFGVQHFLLITDSGNVKRRNKSGYAAITFLPFISRHKRHFYSRKTDGFPVAGIYIGRQ